MSLSSLLAALALSGPPLEKVAQPPTDAIAAGAATDSAPCWPAPCWVEGDKLICLSQPSAPQSVQSADICSMALLEASACRMEMQNLVTILDPCKGGPVDFPQKIDSRLLGGIAWGAGVLGSGAIVAGGWMLVEGDSSSAGSSTPLGVSLLVGGAAIGTLGGILALAQP